MTKNQQEKSTPIKTEEGVDEQKVTKKKRRAKSGARANKQVNDWQKGKKFAISEAAWNRYLRLVIADSLEHIKLEGDYDEADLPDKIKLSKNGALNLRGQVEAKLCDIFRRGNHIRAHTKRKTLFGSDLILARLMAEPTFQPPPLEIKTEVKQES